MTDLRQWPDPRPIVRHVVTLAGVHWRHGDGLRHRYSCTCGALWEQAAASAWVLCPCCLSSGETRNAR